MCKKPMDPSSQLQKYIYICTSLSHHNQNMSKLEFVLSTFGLNLTSGLLFELMGSKILCRMFTLVRDRDRDRDPYCASHFPCTGPGPGPVQCE